MGESLECRSALSSLRRCHRHYVMSGGGAARELCKTLRQMLRKPRTHDHHIGVYADGFECGVLFTFTSLAYFTTSSDNDDDVLELTRKYLVKNRAFKCLRTLVYPRFAGTFIIFGCPRGVKIYANCVAFCTTSAPQSICCMDTMQPGIFCVRFSFECMRTNAHRSFCTCKTIGYKVLVHGAQQACVRVRVCVRACIQFRSKNIKLAHKHAPGTYARAH